MSNTPTPLDVQQSASQPATGQAPEPATDPRPEPTPDDLKSILDELGLTPGQIRARLEAGKEWEKRAKGNSEKAKRFDELEEASKTEQQKALERAEAAERQLADITLKAMRLEVAAEKGVPAELLAGATVEELAASADRLLAFRGEAAKLPPAPPATGLGDVGKPIGDGRDQLTRDDLKGMSPADIEAARVSGRLRNMLGG